MALYDGASAYLINLRLIVTVNAHRSKTNYHSQVHCKITGYHSAVMIGRSKVVG